MTTPFLTYELLTLETADPVVIRITGQKARGFPDFTASNGVEIKTIRPAWVMPHRQLWILGNHLRERDYDPIHIPQRDWPAVKQAIRELNEHYSPVAKAMGDKKEKDMKEEKDKYEFDMQAWDYWWSPSNTNLVLLRKKPKVEDREKLRKIEQEIKEIQTMANNTDIVKEIDCCIDLISDTRNKISREIILSTLQRARDAIVKTQDELRLLSEAQDIMGRPQTAKQLMDIHDMLSAYTPEEK